MKFSCSTTDLLHALQLASRAISSQQALPILGNILIEAEGKRVTISATDLELSIVTSIPATIENEGSITVPAKAILNFAQYNNDAEVLLETNEGTQMKCTSSHSKTMIAGEAASEYPTITPVEKRTSLSLEVGPLLEALHLVTFTSAKSTLRPVLSGVFVRREKESLVFVATDSYRLSEYRIPLPEASEDISCIIPVKVLDELKAVLAARRGKTEDAEEKATVVQVTLGTQQIELTVGSTRLLSRLIEGKFPDYQQIIPKTTASTVTFAVSELTTAAKRMHYFAKEANNSLTFRYSGNQVTVTTPFTQLGRDEATIQADISGEGKIALSSSYLLDFLGHLNTDTVQMRTSDSLHPAIFHLPGNDAFLHLIMPLRLQEE